MEIITLELSYVSFFVEFGLRCKNTPGLPDRLLDLLRDSSDSRENVDGFIRSIKEQKGQIDIKEIDDTVFLRILRFIAHKEKRENELKITCQMLTEPQDNDNSELKPRSFNNDLRALMKDFIKTAIQIKILELCKESNNKNNVIHIQDIQERIFGNSSQSTDYHARSAYKYAKKLKKMGLIDYSSSEPISLNGENSLEIFELNKEFDQIHNQLRAFLNSWKELSSSEQLV